MFKPRNVLFPSGSPLAAPHGHGRGGYPTSKRVLLLTLVLLQLADIVTTNTVLAAGGREANPVMASAMAGFGSLWWLPKLAVAITCALVLIKGRTRYAAAAVAITLAPVVINVINAALVGAL